jgi:enoyl-CoA hydratase/carnithine racemase
MAEQKWRDLEVNAENGVALVRLRRPERRNALSVALMQELIEAASHFRAALDVHAIVLAGGEDYFSAGADLSDPARRPGPSTLLERRQSARLGPDLCAAWEGLEQITIAAVEGYCIGGAAALAFACDFRIGGAGAYFRLPEISLGMNMSWRTLPRVASLAGPSRAKRLAIFCEPCTADEAFQWGLLDAVASKGEALALALEWARKAAALPPIPVRMTKEAVNAAANAMHYATSFMDRDQFVLASGSRDYREGVSAFLEKRPPKFTGE